MRLHPVIAKMDKAVLRLKIAHEDYGAHVAKYPNSDHADDRDRIRRATNAYERARNYASRFVCLQLGGYW